MQPTSSPQEYFRMMLLTVVGQAYAAAGYTLEERPIQWAGGSFRFTKCLPDHLHAAITYQLLAYPEPQPSRFRVGLVRSDNPNPQAVSHHPRFARRTLGQLVVEDFGVAILPSADYWWSYRNVSELGHALAEAGHLVVGYAIPWLAGELETPRP